MDTQPLVLPPNLKLSLIVAMAKNRVIGVDGRMPWHLPSDLAHFRNITKTIGTVLVGRTTLDSIAENAEVALDSDERLVLPDRQVIVVANKPLAFPCSENVEIVSSVQEALERAAQYTDHACIIGGSTLYEATLPLVDTIYLTQIEASLDGDAYFPEVDFSLWKETYSSGRPRRKDYRETYLSSFQTFVRK